MRLYILIILSLTSKIVVGQNSSDSAFKLTKGTWILPIDKITHIEIQQSPRFGCFPPGLVIESDSCVNAYFVQSGQIVFIINTSTGYTVLVKQGSYFICYGGLDSVYPKKGDYIYAGRPIGRLIEQSEGKYQLEMLLSTDDKIDPHLDLWFSNDFQKLITRNSNN